MSLLLYETHIRWLPASLWSFLDRPKLCFIARDILSQRPQDPLRVPWTYDHAAQQLSLRPVREDVNKIECEFLQIVMQHHQIAVLPLQFFFVRFDLHLPWHRPLLFHRLLPLVRFPFHVLFEGITALPLALARGARARFALPLRKKQSVSVLLTNFFVKSSLVWTFTVVNKNSVTEYQ
jgi:hypothetical protein